jgi:hypothetical protein
MFLFFVELVPFSSVSISHSWAWVLSVFIFSLVAVKVAGLKAFLFLAIAVADQIWACSSHFRFLCNGLVFLFSVAMRAAWSIFCSPASFPQLATEVSQI